jgi:signal recognition particle GTPase
MTTKEKQSQLISNLNSLLLSNDLDNQIVFDLIENFYRYGNENYKEGKEMIKEIYNL